MGEIILSKVHLNYNLANLYTKLSSSDCKLLHPFTDI
jgi:hypothetical protein